MSNDRCRLNLAKQLVFDGPSDCSICQLRFPNKQGMRKHTMENHPEIELFKCDHCEIILPSQIYLNLHLRKKHKKRGE